MIFGKFLNQSVINGIFANTCTYQDTDDEGNPITEKTEILGVNINGSNKNLSNGNKEINLINDKEIKDKLLDSTYEYFINNNMLTKEELPYLKAEFGYVFAREDDFIEALYKIMKANGEIMYFALRENKIMRIDFDENKFNETIQSMRQKHPCLVEEKTPEV